MPTREELQALGVELYGHPWQTRTARLLGVAPRTLRRWIAGGDPPEWALERLGRAIGARDALQSALRGDRA